MHYVSIFTSNGDVHTFLSERAASVQERDHYGFTTKTKAIETLSHSFFHHARTEWFAQNGEENADDINLFLSFTSIQQLLSAISKKIVCYFNGEDVMHWEGFYRFHLKDEKKTLHALLEKARLDYHQHRPYSNDIAPLKQFVEEHPRKINQLILVVSPVSFCLKTPFESLLNVGSDEEDLMLSYLLSYAPKQLVISDPHHSLSYETRHIIKEVFMEKVVFYPDVHSNYPH